MPRSSRGFVARGVALAFCLSLAPGLARPSEAVRGAFSIRSAGGGVIVERIGQVGGSIMAVAVQGPYAYVGQEASLLILDISDPARPAPVGRALLPYAVRHVRIVGGYVYLVAGGALWIVDAHTPSAPRVVGNLALPDGAVVWTAAAGDRLYVTWQSGGLFNGQGGLWILDIRDPAAPREIARYREPDLAARHVVLVGRYAYVESVPPFGDDQKKVVILDVGDPANPRKVGEVPDRPIGVGVAVGNYAYGVVTYWGPVGEVLRMISRLVVMDTSHPSAPQVVGILEWPGMAMDLAVADGYAYVASEPEPEERSGGGLHVVDVRDPRAPRRVGTYLQTAQAVTMGGGAVYVGAGGDGLHIFDARTPTALREVGNFPSPFFWDAVAGEGQIYAFSGILGDPGWSTDRMWIIDVRDPSLPRIVGNYRTSSSQWGPVIQSAAASGRYLYLAQTNGLRILDAGNPAAPRVVYSSTIYMKDIALSGSLLYGIDSQALRILDVSNPAAPRAVGSLPTSAYRIAVAGGYAYVDEGNQLRIIDVRDPARPRSAGSYPISGVTIQQIRAAGGYVYLVVSPPDSLGGPGRELWIVDARDPNAPRRAGVYVPPSPPITGMAVNGDYTYLTGGEGACIPSSLDTATGYLWIVDVSDPSAPRLIRSLEVPCTGGIAKAPGYAYVPVGLAGLFIIRVIELNPSLYLPLVLRGR